MDRDSPGRLVGWEELVAALHRAFGLRPVDGPTLEPVEAHHLRRLITSTLNRGEFAARRGWPTPSHLADAGRPEIRGSA